MTWFFKTREGAPGVLQLGGFTKDPEGAKIRYKLVKQSTDAEAVVLDGGRKVSRQTLTERQAAASQMSSMPARDKALATVAIDSAKVGEVELLRTALGQIVDSVKRNMTALEVVRLLAKRGLRRPALEIATGIDDLTVRDQALSELAQ